MREHTLGVAALLNPRSIAVVGASRREDATGSIVMENLLRNGYPGAVHPVNPRYDEIGGRRCYASLSEVPGEVDAVFIAVPARAAVEVLVEAGRRGIRAAYINASGFADGGPGGRAMEAELKAIADRDGIAVCGPNNQGLVNLHDRVAPWTYTVLDTVPGGIAIVTQSGSAATILSDRLRDRGLAFVVTTGTEAVLTTADYLEPLVADDRVTTIALFIETIRDPERFAEAAETARLLGKPILAIKLGRSVSGEAAVSAHSGGLAGDDEAYAAFFRRHGIIRVADFDELVATTTLFASYPVPPADAGVAAVTLSGGEAALIADLASDADVLLPPLDRTAEAKIKATLPPFSQLARNPLDAFGLEWDPGRVMSMADALLDVPHVGTLLLAMDYPDQAEAVARFLAPRVHALDKRCVLTNNLGAAAVNETLTETLEATGMPVIPGLRAAIVALGHWTRHQYRSPARPAVDDAALSGIAATMLERAADDDVVAFAALRRLGIPMARVATCASPGEVVDAARDIGYPVALKGMIPGVTHKARLGLVKLGLGDDADVERAAREVLAAIAASGHSAPAASIQVQEMISDGAIELFVGARSDPLGTLIIVGAGGTDVEAQRDVVSELAPVTEDEAGEMLEQTIAGRRLTAVGGTSLADAVRAIAAFSELVAACGPALAAMEINPLIVRSSFEGIVGVDLVRERGR